jgi:hypothetical protein
MGNFKQYLLIGLLLFCGQGLLAQMNRTWFSAVHAQLLQSDGYNTLKGKVKTWTMRNEKGQVRQQQYDSSGQLLSDTYKETPQTYIPPEFLPAQYKKQHEKKYSTALSRKEPGLEIRYNGQFQLIEKKRYQPIVDSLGRATGDSELVYQLTNRFNKAGQIVSSHLWQKVWHHVTADSRGPVWPPRSYSVVVHQMLRYNYNAAGKITEFQNYEDNSQHNLRIVYRYDANNNLIEQLRYDDYNIEGRYDRTDDAFKPIAQKIHETDFDINKIYPGYWGQGLPSKETWRYNTQSQPIEYLVYGYMKGLSFKANWEYDGRGQLAKELQYDVNESNAFQLRREVWFDAMGNVKEELDYVYNSKNKHRYFYDIVYY